MAPRRSVRLGRLIVAALVGVAAWAPAALADPTEDPPPGGSDTSPALVVVWFLGSDAYQSNVPPVLQLAVQDFHSGPDGEQVQWSATYSLSPGPYIDYIHYQRGAAISLKAGDHYETDEQLLARLPDYIGVRFDPGLGRWVVCLSEDVHWYSSFIDFPLYTDDLFHNYSFDDTVYEGSQWLYAARETGHPNNWKTIQVQRSGGDLTQDAAELCIEPGVDPRSSGGGSPEFTEDYVVPGPLSGTIYSEFDPAEFAPDAPEADPVVAGEVDPVDLEEVGIPDYFARTSAALGRWRERFGLTDTLGGATTGHSFTSNANFSNMAIETGVEGIGVLNIAWDVSDYITLINLFKLLLNACVMVWCFQWILVHLRGL